MSSFLLGLLALPAGLLTVVALFLVWRLLGWGYAETIIWKPRFGRRVYAYKVRSVTGGFHHDADKLVNSTFIERRNLGKTHTYRITYDGTSAATVTAERIPGSGRWRSHQHDVQWDEETVTEMDAHL